MHRLNKIVDGLSNYFAARKGLLILTGIALIALNWILQFFPQIGWLSTSDLLLHLGIIVALLGIMLAWAL